jgi:rare lipoprotein A
MYSMTAAHKTLPMHTYVRVTNLGNGRQAVVRINDRGPFAKRRIIDLSYAAARKVGMIASGTAQVKIQALGEVRTGRGEPARFVRLPDIQNGRFFVQVGAFQDAHNAQNLRRKLTSHYNNVVVSRQISGKDTLYRVQIFAANNYSEAKAVEARIEKSGFPGAFLVAR